ncbi:MAG: hypothetical protein WA751_08225 [Candidatus Dormiibacterota bacterium]
MRSQSVLGPAFAVLLFSRVAVLGLRWLVGDGGATLEVEDLEVVRVWDQGYRLTHFDLDSGVDPGHTGSGLVAAAGTDDQWQGLVLPLGHSPSGRM